jgi:hypothetical protein
MNTKTKENVLAVVLALLGLVFVTAFVGTVLSQEPDIKPLRVYVTNSTGK